MESALCRALRWRLPSLTTFLLRFFAPTPLLPSQVLEKGDYSLPPLSREGLGYQPSALGVYSVHISAVVTSVLGLSSAQPTAQSEQV